MVTANEGVISRAYDAFGAGDMATLKNESFAPDITWTWPGSGPLAGVYKDSDAVLGLFGKLVQGSGGSFKVAPESITELGNMVVVRSRASWNDDKGSHADPYVQVFRMENGKAAECCIHFNDVALWDQFPA